ncbi:PHD finger protein 23A isoform X2 [Anabrus simplex]|uniref:PHD finger protein 23A isoform X2 n=1 Tax=Anabrus simplex TaxID=316456 RepID=UPI0035A3102B
MYVVKMTETVFKAPKMKKESAVEEDGVLASSSKRPRTAEDFYLFCTFILEYEKYGLHKQEELIEQDSSPVSSPESVEDCGRPELLNSSDQKDQKEPSESASQDDSYDLVTCYCSKPFAGRAMIECSKCLTWIHLSCAKIKKTNIPEVFICVKCKNQKCGNIPSNSTVRPKKRVSV